MLTALVEELNRRNYSVHVDVLEAWKYRVPQHRSRLFVAAFAEGVEFHWPTPIGRRTTLRQAIGDLPKVPGDTREEAQLYCGPPKSPTPVIPASVSTNTNVNTRSVLLPCAVR